MLLEVKATDAAGYRLLVRPPPLAKVGTMTETISETIWCYYRNALHSSYREIRHLGVEGDPQCRAIAPPGYESQAEKCRSNRQQLKSSVPFRSVSNKSVSAYINAYESLTGLEPEQLVELFTVASWTSSYGGEKWASIANLVVELGRAIDAVDTSECLSLCEQLRSIQHNSGSLIPTRAEWEQSPYKREKWPELCEDVEA
jgi:hypothetical protein